MSKTNLKATKREVVGRKVKKLRSDGKLPANIYGKKIKSQSVSVDIKEFEKVYRIVGETGLVDLAIDGNSHPVLIHDVQNHPVTGDYLHVDFLQVNLKERVKTQIPVEMIGESPAEKTGIGTAVQYLDEVEVEALPTDLVDKFEIDASTLIDLESVITVADLKVDKSKITIFNEADQIVAKVEPPQEEEVETIEAEETVSTGDEQKVEETTQEVEPQNEKKEESN